MTNELDIGPLSWVKDEIELALGQASDQLQKYAGQQDAVVLGLARASLHQAHGALSIVGLDGVTEFSRAIERLLEALAAGDTPWSSAIGETAQAGIATLRQYLDELIAGRPNQPMRLLPVYRDLNAARNAGETQASDLFFPDLTQRPPKRDNPATPMPDEPARQARLKAARLGFERGLAKWIDHESAKESAGIRDMRNSIAIIEALQEPPATRAFWWVTLAWFDALAGDGIPHDDAARRLCERIGEQVTKLLDGAPEVSERLMRDVLYAVATTNASSAHIERVRAAYRLRELRPAETQAGDPRETLLDEMRERLAAVSASWEQFCAGAAIALPRFHEQSTQLAAQAQKLGQVDLARLAAAMANTANLLRKNPLLHNDALANELATALLLTELAIHRFAALDVDFAAQVDALTGRLNGLQRGETLPPHELPALQALAQRASGRRGIHQLAQGLRAELQRVEQALDAFFRAPANGDGLDDAVGRLQKISGMFAQLDQPRAVQVVQECAASISAFAAPGHARQSGEFEALARKISALGFFVEQLQHGPADLDVLLTPRTRTEAAPPASKEASVATVTDGVPAGLTLASAAAQDEELLAIFVEEALQVLDTVGIQLYQSMANPDDLKFLTELRRGFHTLKGSSRMVGLADFSDAACAVEITLGAHLQSGMPATPELHAMVHTARAIAADWIERLQRGDGAPDVAPLQRQCEALRQREARDAALAVDSVPLAAAPVAATAPPMVAASTPARALSHDLLPLFLEECEDLIPAATAAFRDWRGQPGASGASAAEALQRILHTLKGSARMAGVGAIGEAIHGIETRISQARRTAAPAAIDELEAAFDHIASRIDDLRTAPDAGTGKSRPMLRVSAELIDAMVNESGEIAIARSRIEGGVKSQRAALGDLTENIARLRAHLRELEIQAESRIQSNTRIRHEPASNPSFDPLEMDRFTRLQELTRIIAESVNDVATVEHGLMRDLDQIDTALTQQARLSRELTRRLMGVRMVPFLAIEERLRRVVRMTADEAGKQVAFSISGGETDIDRSVLERMTGPIEHLLRNAVVHGIEAAHDRSQAGKPVQGEVRLALAQAGNEVVISVADDGAGLDYARIRGEALKRGLVSPAQSVSEEQLTQLIYQPGFTTASTLSESAGRGIGMDAVRSETMALGGHVETKSVTGSGAVFSLHLPLTLSVIPTVLVKSGARTYAIPSSMVVQASEVKAEAMVQLRAAGVIEWQGQRYPLHYLPRLLGADDALPAPQRRHWVVLLRGGVQHIALELDALIGNEEVVLKNTGPQLARVPGISGATVLGDGEVVLIVNPITLADAQARKTPRPDRMPAAATPTDTAQAAAPPTVMVVDDSLTVRKVTGRLLERAGYRVATAKDGIDALEQLAELTPAVMLADIEMPRMDGFELLRRLRADNRFQSLPVIMITSRIADKHRHYAQEVGANHYLGKPYDEQALLAMIAEYIKTC